MYLPFLLFVLIAIISLGQSKEYNIFCYWGTWSYYRKNDGRFLAWNIEPKLCTHLAYAFIGVDDKGAIQILDNYLDIELENIRQTANERLINPKLKVLISVGGWKHGSTKFSAMAANKSKRRRFISSVLAFLYKWHINGLDLDWEYPAQRGGALEDRQNFVILLKELKNVLSSHDFLLSVAVSPEYNVVEQSYDIPNITKNVDIVNLMTYDFYGPWNRKLGHSAPLYGKSSETVSKATQNWIRKSGNPSKILLGIPFYGHTFTLFDPINITIGASSIGAGLPGAATQHAGFLAYNEFCVQATKWYRKYDTIAKVPYAYKGTQWLSYDNEQSIYEKLNFAKSQGLGGAMIWSIDMDDFNGKCGKPYPLLNSVNVAMGNHKEVTQEASTTERQALCEENGVFANELDCSRYYECRSGDRKDYKCLNGFYFDPKIGQCNLAKLVDCKPHHLNIWKPNMKKLNWRNFPLDLKVL